MTVIAAHHRANHLAIYFRDEKQADIVVNFTLNVHFRVIPRRRSSQRSHSVITSSKSCWRKTRISMVFPIFQA